MKRVKVLMLIAGGTNCDRETEFSFRYVGAQVERIHINMLIKNKDLLLKYQIFCIPGGFTYGDDVSAGKILANQVRFLLYDEVKRFYEQGGLILGICNGFQVLLKSGILPWGPFSEQETSLILNDSGRFMDKWVNLKVSKDTSCIWLKDLPPVISLPIACAEGKFVVKSSKITGKLIRNNQIALRYCTPQGEVVSNANPTGSVENIAGISDPEGRILGLMPHPERHFFNIQSPFCSFRKSFTLGDGFLIFKNGVEYAKHLS